MARRTGLVEEPTDRAEQLSDSALPCTEIVGQLGQDLADPADVFVSVPEAVVLVTEGYLPRRPFGGPKICLAISLPQP
jgi:hypothetical protein